MSVTAGPSISTNGLVFHYDLSNTQKSWLGAPTTNLVSQGNTNNTIAYARSAGATVITDQIQMPQEVLKYSGSKTLADTISSSSNFWVAYTAGPSVTQGQQYIASWYIYGVSGNSISFNWGGAHQGNYSSFTVNLLNGSVSGVSMAAGEIYSISREDNGWWRLSCSTTMINGTNCYPQINSNAGTLSACGVQIELGNVASRYLIGSRSTTQSILDLTNNNIITATNLTYNVDGTFGFNGTSTFLRPNITHSYLSSSSLEVWFRSTSHGGSGVKKTIFGYSHNEGFSQPTIGSMYLENNNLLASVITASQVYRTVTAASTISTSTWYHAVLNKDTINGTLNLYLNGVLSGTQTFDPVSYGQWTTTGTFIGVNVLDIGKSTNNSVGQGWSTAYFSGSIPVAKVYSRVLTDAEIQSNFNATRSRFGL
jgi:hypothetical protein